MLYILISFYANYHFISRPAHSQCDHKLLDFPRRYQRALNRSLKAQMFERSKKGS